MKIRSEFSRALANVTDSFELFLRDTLKMEGLADSLYGPEYGTHWRLKIDPSWRVVVSERMGNRRVSYYIPSLMFYSNLSREQFLDNYERDTLWQESSASQTASD